ncbi:unnamed protein product [Brachionus calyciflorus]|uniref:Uncharacterized protein n=1 Tax=Brachionus calyciflorus TaxID=104777 RepID=A0A813LVX8_9BILA|nr:unnamed protein product [Brachionus calyciflorus]
MNSKIQNRVVLDTKFYTRKKDLEQKLEELKDFKNNRTSHPLSKDYYELINQIDKYRHDTIQTINSYFNNLILKLDDDLKELDTELSNISVELIEAKIETLTEDTLQQTKRFKTEGFDREYNQLIERRTELIEDLTDTIDFAKIYSLKLSNHSSLFLKTKQQFQACFNELNTEKKKELKKKNFKKDSKLQAHDSSIICIREVQDEKFLTCSNTQIKIWNQNNLECTCDLNNSYEIMSCCLVLSENEILTGSQNGIINLWDMSSKKVKQVFKGHTNEITCLEYYNENQFWSGSKDKSLKLWEKQTGQAIMHSYKHGHQVNCMLVFNLKSEDLIVSGSSDKSIYIFYLNSKRAYTRFYHSDSVLCLEKLEHKNLLLSGSDDWTIKIWNMNKKMCINTLNHTGSIRSIKLIDDDSILSCSIDNTIRMWCLKKAECKETKRVAFDYDSKILLASNFDLIFSTNDFCVNILHPFEI